jgi:hypothetical protein
MVLTGYTTSFHKQPLHIRESIMEGWRASYLPTLNLIYRQMMVIAKNLFLKTSPSYRELIDVPAAPESVS